MFQIILQFHYENSHMQNKHERSGTCWFIVFDYFEYYMFYLKSRLAWL